MRILHTVEFYDPSVGGAQEVVKQVSEFLVQRGHSVTIATSYLPNRKSLTVNGVKIKEFDIRGNAANGMHGETQKYQDFLLKSNYDVIMNYAAQQWATDLAMPILGEIKGKKVLAPCGFSGLHNERYRDYFESIPNTLRQYDHIILHGESYQDAEFLRKHKIHNYHIVPNGASSSEFQHKATNFRSKFKISETQPLLITVGTHTGTKGHELTIRAFRKAKIGGATLLIIGNSPDQGGCLNACKKLARNTKWLSFGTKVVHVLDLKREDTVSAIKASDVFVFGSNIECSPIVLYEAMAGGCPFITTDCGNAKEIIEWSKGGLLVPSKRNNMGWTSAKVRPFAMMIERLIHDNGLRKQLENSGRKSWKSYFTWEKITEKYELIYNL